MTARFSVCTDFVPGTSTLKSATSFKIDLTVHSVALFVIGC